MKYIYHILGILLIYAASTQAALTHNELLSQAGKIEACIAQLEDDQSQSTVSRATLELALDVLRAKLADIRTLILNLSFSGFEIIESEIAIIESQVGQLDQCGATPITQDGPAPTPVILIESAGITIDNPGSYCLAKDLDATAVLSAVAITINASDVTLNLNSKTITGAGLDTFGINIAQELSNITIKNGTIVNVQIGINADTSDMNACTIKNCTFIDCFTAISLNEVTNCTISDCFITSTININDTISGLILSGNNCTISNCLISGMIGQASIFGFDIVGTANLIQQCHVEGIASTSLSTGSIVAAFRLPDGGSCNKIIDCTVDSVTTTASGFAHPFGIKLEALTGSISQLTGATINTSAGAQSVDWSPDGQYLAVGTLTSASTELQVYKLTEVNGFVLLSGASIEINADVQSVNWSADGQFIAVGSSLAGGQLQVYSFAGEQLTLVDSVDAGAIVNSVSWSPDGNYVLVGTVTPNTEEVQIWSFASGVLTLVTQITSGSVTGVDWAPNGQFFAIATGNSIIIYQFNGVSITLRSTVVRGNLVREVAWSPHGDFVAVTSDPADTFQLVVYPVSSGGILGSAITAPIGNVSKAVAWSPDGIYLVSTEDLSSFDIYRLTANTAGVFSLSLFSSFGPFGTTMYSTAWSRDGHTIAVSFLNGGPGQIVTYEASFDGSTDCIIKDCVVSCVSGGSGTGVGISASSDNNTARANVSFNNDINYVGLTNVYLDGYLGTPTLLQNIAIPPL